MVAAIPTMASTDEMLAIVVSPNTLNLESNGGVLTIHAEIGYSAEWDVKVEVNGEELPDPTTFPDSRGELVVRCSMATLRGMLQGSEEAIFILTLDDALSGTDTIRVISVGK
jgi:hypothetical protein